MATLKIQANAVMEGDYIPGIDNGYVFEAEEGNGYLSYPQTSYGVGTAMPDDTVLIGFHDADGQECYLMLPGESMLTVERS